MKYIYFVLGVLAFARLSSSGANAAPATQAVQDYKETKDRLSSQTMERLVAGPIATLRKHGLAAAKMDFRLLLARTAKRRGTHSVQVADLLTSFGVELFIEGVDEDKPTRLASIEYLRAAVPAYRAAFGPRHPEVAVALSTLGDDLMNTNKDDPPAEADTAFEEAYSIRMGALGMANPETRASLRELAGVRGLPSRVKGDPQRLDAAVAMFNRLLVDAPKAPFDVTAPYVRMRLAVIYALNGKAKDALEQADVAKADASKEKDVRLCVQMSALTSSLADALQKGGNKAAAESLGSENVLTGLLTCGSEPQQPEAQAVASI